MAEIETAEFALDGSFGIRPADPCASGSSHRLARAEILYGQGRLAPVPPGYLMYDPHRILVPPFAHVILGRLEDRERHKADEEHDERDAAHRDNEVSPAHVLGAGADRLIGLASPIPQEWPSDEGSEQLREGPEDGEDGKEVLV